MEAPISFHYNDTNLTFVNGPFSNQTIKNEQDALLALEDIKEELQLQNGQEEFILERKEQNENVTYYRFQQMYKGLPVLNQNIILATINEKANSFSGHYLPHIKVDTTPQKTKEEVEFFVKQLLKEKTEIQKNNLVIWEDSSTFKLAYHVLACTEEEIVELLIDASTLEVLAKEDVFTYVKEYSYTGYGMDYIEYTISLEEFYDVDFLKNRYRFFDSQRNIAIADYRYLGLYSSAMISALPGTTPFPVDIENDKIVASLPKNREFVESAVSAMAHFSTVYDFYKDVLERNSYDGKGGKIIVNLGVAKNILTTNDLNNAAWFPPTDQIYVGNYEGKSLAASLDVLGHEFTHGVITYTANFASIPKEKDKAFEAGALNEGYADVLGTLIEGKNWTIGENNIVARNLENPESMGHPGKMHGKYYYPDQYFGTYDSLEEFMQAKEYEYITDYDKGGVHRNANVIGHAAYLMEASGAFKNREEMAKVWYNSLFLLSSYSTFKDCALAILKTAENLGLDALAIYKIKDAFYKTKILEGSDYTLNGKVVNDIKEVRNATIEIYLEETNQLVYRTLSNEKGEFSYSLLPGKYRIQVSKTGFENFLEILEITKDTNYTISLESKGTETISTACTTKDCVKVTFYYMDTNEKEMVENHITEVINKGAILGNQYILEAADFASGIELKSDGKTFVMDIGGVKLDFAWYYRGSDRKFDWNVPIEKDTEIEMKIANGIFDNDSFIDSGNGQIDIDSILEATDYFENWFQEIKEKRNEKYEK